MRELFIVCQGLNLQADNSKPCQLVDGTTVVEEFIQFSANGYNQKMEMCFYKQLEMDTGKIHLS